MIALVFALIAAPTLTLQLDGAQLGSHRLAIDWNYSESTLPAPRVCVPMTGAGAAVKEPLVTLSNGKKQALKPSKDDGDCFVIDPTATHLTYVIDLDRLSQVRNDPDFASRVQNGWLFNDQAVFIRPETYPMTLQVRVTGPRERELLSVWDTQNGVHLADADQLEGGAYFAMIERQSAKQLEAPAGVTVLRLGTKSADAVSDEVLQRWVGTALKGLVQFHGMLPSERLFIALVPSTRSKDAGIFGTVLRRHRASVVLWYGEQGPAKEYDEDWLAIHEIFHSGVPHMWPRAAWFVEGFTTYYQEIVRLRLGTLTPEALWNDFHDGLVRFAQPDGHSLRDESANLRKWHHYQQVYWAGACVALLVDVRIRERSEGKRSLDSFMREALMPSAEKPFTEASLIEALEKETGSGFVTKLVDENKHLDLDALYKQLGLVVVSPTEVKLSASPMREALAHDHSSTR